MLVELKQPAPKVELFTTAVRHSLGDFELITLSDGFISLDGGAMFGIVPRPLWEKRLPPDDANRIPLGMRPLIVRDGKTTVIIDAGCGDKMDEKSTQIYKLDRRYHLDHSLADAGLSAGDIDIVIASHLHFDHVGGFTKIGPGGALSAAVPQREICRASRRVGGCHASARAQSRQLPAGELRPAERRRRGDARRRWGGDHPWSPLPAIGRTHARTTRS